MYSIQELKVADADLNNSTHNSHTICNSIFFKINQKEVTLVSGISFFFKYIKIFKIYLSDPKKDPD